MLTTHRHTNLYANCVARQSSMLYFNKNFTLQTAFHFYISFNMKSDLIFLIIFKQNYMLKI